MNSILSWQVLLAQELDNSEGYAQPAGTINKHVPAPARAENFGDLEVGILDERGFEFPTLKTYRAPKCERMLLSQSLQK